MRLPIVESLGYWEKNDWSAYRLLRNTVTRLIRYSKASYTRSILRENVYRSKEFWGK